MSMEIGKDLDKYKHVEENVANAESDNEEEFQEVIENYEDVPDDMMVLPQLGPHQHVPNSPSPPPASTTMSVAGSFMSSLIRGLTSPVNTPSSPFK